MSLIQTIPSGKDFEFSGDLKTGLLTQNPQYGPSTNTWSADGDKEYGTPILFRGLHRLTADGTTTITFLNKSNPFKLRVLRVGITPRTLRTGGTVDCKINVFNGDGAASESRTALITEIDLDADTLDVIQYGVITDAQELIAVGGSLISETVISGSSTTGTYLCDVLIECLRVKA